MTLKQHNDQIFEHNEPNPTPDTRQGWAQPCSSSSSSSLERETWKRGRVEPPDTNYKALKNQRFSRQSPNASYSPGFHNCEKTEISKNTRILTNQTREVNEINCGHRCITGRLFWSPPKNNLMEIRLCPQASNETSHRIEKPAIFKNIYKHEPLAILEL